MAKINIEKDNDNKSIWKYVLIGILVVGLIVLLYYGFFIGAADEAEEREEPAVIEQSLSQNSPSLQNHLNYVVPFEEAAS